MDVTSFSQYVRLNVDGWDLIAKHRGNGNKGNAWMQASIRPLVWYV